MAQLAQCSIHKLTVHFADPHARLQRVPHGAEVVYCLLEPELAATAAEASSFWADGCFEEFQFSSHEPSSPPWQGDGEDTDGSEWAEAEADMAL